MKKPVQEAIGFLICGVQNQNAPNSSQEVSEPVSSGLTRRTFLKSAATLATALSVSGLASLSANAASGRRPRNLILFLNDQERAIRWFPQGWAEANLPGMMELKRTGVSFVNACTNTAMCTPARATLFSGFYPAQSLCKDTLTEHYVQSETEFQLDPTLPNLAKVLKEAGYEVVYKGKWHISKGVEDAEGNFINDDISRYGFDDWNPPDAGQDTATANYGGGNADHDTRFINDALAYLQDKMANPGDKPFCLVVSLVNPHDVLGYPGLGIGDDWLDGGYGPADLLGNIDLPPTVDEDLANNFKPTCQAQLLQKLQGLGLLNTNQRKRNYLNFYGNLMIEADQKLKQIVDLLDSSAAGQELRRNTWIVRTADHGEMGMAHGGMRQKAFQCYEESIRIPLIWSNTADYPAGRGLECQHLVSHVDFLPTVCSTLLGMTNWKTRYGFPGVDYKPLIANPRATRGVQDTILFTYGDIYAGMNADGQPQGVVAPPNRIQMLRSLDYKYARYFDGDGVAPDQEEFYDLRIASKGGTDTDPATGLPRELTNASVWADQQRRAALKPVTTPGVLVQQRTLFQRNLQTATKKLLVPRPPGAVVEPMVSQRLVTLPGDVRVLEFFWVSRATTEYMIQVSQNDGVSWEDVDGWIPGNNGPILVEVMNPLADATYRLQWRGLA